MVKQTTKELLSHLTDRQVWILLVAYTTLMIALALLLQQFVDRAWLRQTVNQTEPFGFLVFLLVEYIYIIFVPIYNTAIHLAAGYIFGGYMGWLLNFVATTAGLFTIIILVKRFGRPLLLRVVPQRIYKKYDSLTHRMGPMALFLIYVLPLFPDDEVTYMIAAGPVRFTRFVLPVLLGNVTKAAVSFIGDEGFGGLGMALGTRLVVLVVGLVLIGIQEYMFKVYSREGGRDSKDGNASPK